MKNAQAAIFSRRAGGGVKCLSTGGGENNFRTGAGVTFARGGSVPHYMTCLNF